MHELPLVTRFATRSTTGVRESLRALPLVLAVAALAGATACGSSTSTNVTAPTTPSRCQASVQGAPTSFGPSGGTGTISVGVARECSWSATSTVPWIELTSAREGQGEGSIGYRVGPNSDPVTRSGGIAVGEQRVNVSQQAAPCSFQVSRSADSIGPDGGQIAVNIATHSACQWTAATEAPWITPAPGSGQGPASVQLTFAANPGAARSATVTVAGQSLAFTQTERAADPPPPPPPAPPPQPPAPPQCSFEIRPDSRDFDAIGGSGAFTLAAEAGCPWTATSSATWLTITSQTSGSGGAEVGYFVDPNPTFSSREATISVAGATHRVRQSGLSGDGDDDDDDDGDGVRIRGVVSALSGSCPALRFVVQGATVTTSSRTDFRRGNCSHVANGVEVQVEGTRQGDGQITARSVTLLRDD
jgi:hypothetical protein